MAAPQGPTTASKTPAMEGTLSPASSGWVIKPRASTDTRTYMPSAPANPSKVARPTSARLAAREE